MKKQSFLNSFRVYNAEGIKSYHFKFKNTHNRNRSSSNCDGQILVTDDMIGLSGFYPKFVKKYLNLDRLVEKAVKKYARDVRINKFPATKNFLNGTKYRK